MPDSDNQAYDMMEILLRIFDDGDVFQVAEQAGPAIITAFARVDGRPVGVIANQPMYMSGAIDNEASDKAARFVRFCDSFNTPLVFVVDTPGFQTRHGTALNRTLNRTVLASLADVDVVLFVVEAGRFGLDDAKVLALMPEGKPVLLVANKLDALARRQDVLPWLKTMQERHAFAEYVPMSARRDADIERLLAIVEPYLPEQPWFHEEDALTDRSERFLASEIIREKLFRLTGDELPYSCTVVIDRFEEEGGLRRIAATIVVERDAHKGMVIGASGERLKRIGSEARQELQTLLDARVHLELWVKVRSGWADDEQHLRSYGYE